MSLRVLIFGTTYVDTTERKQLAYQWADLHETRNPGCDLLFVDSNSPFEFILGLKSWGSSAKVWRKFFSFPDNIGHLSKGGRDGWGRAFCRGLQTAIRGGYDYVVHIEGDSLFRLPVMPIIEQMSRDGIKAASVPIGYGEAQRSAWVETGLMFFEVEYLKQSNFIAGYDWLNRTAKPQPEIVIRKMLGDDLVMLPLKAERSDKDEITVDNVTEYDWITHCQPAVYDRFVQSALR
jgi:hypothetical protein